MGIGLDIFGRRGGRPGLANVLLALAALFALAAFVRALWLPVYVSEGAGKRTVKAAKPGAERISEPRSAYSVIVEKDLFRPARQKYVPPPPKPAPKPFVPPPPPPKPPPRLTLIGTVLLDDGEAAIMDYPGGGQKSSYYRVGDEIEGFVVTEIRKDSVLLKRGDETLKVVMNQPPSSSLPPVPGTAPVPAGQRVPVITPLPVPPAPPAR